MAGTVDIPYRLYLQHAKSLEELMAMAGHDNIHTMMDEVIGLYEYYTRDVIGMDDYLVLYDKKDPANPKLMTVINECRTTHPLIGMETYPAAAENFIKPPGEEEIAVIGDNMTKAIVLYEQVVSCPTNKLPGVFHTLAGKVEPLGFEREPSPIAADTSSIYVPGDRGPLLH